LWLTTGLENLFGIFFFKFLA